MLDSRLRMLITSVHKLYRRGAKANVQKIIVKAHTADIAEVIDNLDTGENLEVFRLEPSLERRSEIISYLKPELQKELLFMMDEDEAFEVVNRMESDDAADLLGHLPEELSNKLLKMMEREDSEEVSDLMRYPEDSAGGLMSSDFLALSEDLTVKEAIKEIQSLDDDSLIMFYLYVLDKKERLVGVLSLKQLLLAKPGQLLKSVLTSDVISVDLSTDQQEVAKIVERYDFLAMPVVDESKKLMGVITVDDVIDVIREEVEEELMAMGRAGWSADVSILEHIRARFPWLLLTFFGGFLCFYMIAEFLGDELMSSSQNWWYSAATLPMILALGATSGNQAVSIALGSLREANSGLVIGKHMLKEFAVSLPLSIALSVLSFIVMQLFLDSFSQSVFLSALVGGHVLLAVAVGAFIPLWMQRVKIDPTVISIPLYIFVVDVLGVFTLFAASKLFLGRM